MICLENSSIENDLKEMKKNDAERAEETETASDLLSFKETYNQQTDLTENKEPVHSNERTTRDLLKNEILKSTTYQKEKVFQKKIIMIIVSIIIFLIILVISAFAGYSFYIKYKLSKQGLDIIEREKFNKGDIKNEIFLYKIKVYKNDIINKSAFSNAYNAVKTDYKREDDEAFYIYYSENKDSAKIKIQEMKDLGIVKEALIEDVYIDVEKIIKEKE